MKFTLTATTAALLLWHLAIASTTAIVHGRQLHDDDGNSTVLRSSSHSGSASTTTMARRKAAAAASKTFTTTKKVAPLLQDNVAILVNVPGRADVNRRTWGDSYSVGDRCYCDSTFDHGIGDLIVTTAVGNMTVRDACHLVGQPDDANNGGSHDGRPRPQYNDIQCGNGPPNDYGDERDCPGRIEYGQAGCRYIGPVFRFDNDSINTTSKVVVAVPAVPPTTKLNGRGRTRITLTLVDTTTNLDIGALKGGDVIPLGGNNLSVRADPSRAVDSVEFFLDGTSVRNETVAPYALQGDDNGKYTRSAKLSTVGTHTIRAVARRGGKKVGSVSVEFAVRHAATDDDKVPVPVVTLALIRTSNSRTITILDDNSVIDLAATPRHTILAETAQKGVGAVVFKYDGECVRTETTAPYLITAVQPQNNKQPKLFRMSPGFHSVTATVIVKDREVASTTVTFRVIDSSVRTRVRLTLVNAKTNQDIGQLRSGDEIDHALASKQLTVRATTDPVVDKIKFYHGGKLVQVERNAPFAIGGTTGLDGDDYMRFRRLGRAGPHTIRAVAFVGQVRVGSIRVDFVVKPDCSTVKCPIEIECEFGYESVATPGECCPNCQLQSNCREVQCPTSPCPPICEVDCSLVACPAVLCPPRYNPVIPEGECCPTCEPDCSIVGCAQEIKCEFGYESVVPPGECCPVCRLKPECKQPLCKRRSGNCPAICKVDCSLVLCPAVVCNAGFRPVTSDGECCPTCEPDCSAVKCAKEIECEFGYISVVTPEECCPVCQLKQECKQPLCKRRGGKCPAICKVDCSLVLCPPIKCSNGYQSVTFDGECCPRCEPVKTDCSTVKCAQPLCEHGYEAADSSDQCCPLCQVKAGCQDVQCARDPCASAMVVSHEVVTLQEGLRVTFTTDEAAATLTVDMLYEGLGWIAFGWSSDWSMAGSVAAITLPDDGTGLPAKWDLFYRSKDGVTLVPDERQNLVDGSYFQNATHTGMTFTKSLVDNDEPPISIDGKNHFLYAVGAENTLGYHARRNAFTHKFSQPPNSPMTSDDLCCPTCEQMTNNNPGRQLEDSGPTFDLFLVRTSNNRDIVKLDESTVIDLATAPRHTVRVNTALTGTVVFEYDGVWVRSDTLAPFLMTTMKPGGKPKPFRMLPGTHSIAASLISDGSTVATTTVNFRVIDGNLPSNVISLTLVDATANVDIAPLESGDVIYLGGIGDELSVRADPSQAVDSIAFIFDGVSVRSETLAPYALGGDKNGNYKRFGKLTKVGTHTIKAIATSAGNVVSTLTVAFTVDEGTVDPPSSKDRYDITLGIENIPLSHKEFFLAASARWESVIAKGLTDSFIGESPNFNGCNLPSGGFIDDIAICARYQHIDGLNGVLGSAGPSHIDIKSGLAIAGIMRFDAIDATGLFSNKMAGIVMHEMGHVLGVGTLWGSSGVIGSVQDQCPYLGANANAEYSKISQCANADVPTELDGGSGTRCGHFDEECLQNELMTGFIDDNMPLSRITIGSLDDIGYSVDYSAADAYASDDLGVCPPCPNREMLSMLDQPHGKTRQLGLRRTKQTRKLSDSMRQYAINVGHSILKNNAVAALNLKSRLETDELSPADSNVQYVGDKVISVIVEDDGGVFGVIVKSDE